MEWADKLRQAGVHGQMWVGMCRHRQVLAAKHGQPVLAGGHGWASMG